MIDDLSPAVVRSIDEAKNPNVPGGIDAKILILSLIEDDDSRASQLLFSHGANLEQVREMISQLSELPFDFPKVLTKAREIAADRHETGVTGEYLILGIVSANPWLQTQLRSTGLNLDALIAPQEIPVLPLAQGLEIDRSTEFLSAGRIIDVNANRARESLRILDDHCRFVLNDRVLTNQVKQLRHDLVSLLNHLPANLLIEARDTPHDVGTTVSTATEQYRSSTNDIAMINSKRLEESLRSMEEYVKLIDSDLAQGLEQIRYRSYEFGRVLALGQQSRHLLENAHLYCLLTASQCYGALEWTIAEAALGGVAIFQLREKSLSDRELLARAQDVRRWTKKAGALFIVNDRPDIARAVGADGVHLGQDDLTVADARKVLGPGPIIGVSTHEIADVERAILDGANYIGIGPTFPSTTKSFEAFPGLKFIQEASLISTLPAFAIGGISVDNVAQVVAAGARRIAVSSAIAAAEDPRAIAQVLMNQLQR